MGTGLVVYGVDGMMEWNAIIPAGTARVNIPFKHGSYDGRGVSAATFRTSDPFFQAVIEHSDYYASGKIFIISDHREVVSGQESVGSDQYEEVSGQESEGESLTEVEVSSREDAKQYMIAHFGFSASSLKSKASILAAAKANGVLFVGADDL